MANPNYSTYPEWVQALPSKLSAMETLFEALVAEDAVECSHCTEGNPVEAIIVTAGGATPVCGKCS